MTLWAWAGMQPHFLAYITLVMAHHAPIRRYLLPKTLQVSFPNGIRLCWAVKVRFKGGQNMTFLAPLGADFF